MATQVGVTLVKRLTYRGDATEEYSNQYWFNGSVPADSTAWKALYDALIAQEKTVYISEVTVVRAYGYDSDAEDAVAVDSYDYLAAAAAVPGTLALGSGAVMSGDCAVWVRWKTDRLNTKGKAIYLRKYFHPAMATLSNTGSDVTMPGQVTALNAFGTKLMDGSFIDARTLTARGHSGDTLLSRASSPYVTTRSLKRRGKRPSS
jgi:hypothetical protein